jgi:hypothetical protein
MVGLTVSAPIGCDIRCAGAGCRISPAEAHGMAASADTRPAPRTLPGGVSSGAGVSNKGCGGRVPALVRFAVDRISPNRHRSTAARDRSSVHQPNAIEGASSQQGCVGSALSCCSQNGFTPRGIQAPRRSALAAPAELLRRVVPRGMPWRRRMAMHVMAWWRRKPRLVVGAVIVTALVMHRRDVMHGAARCPGVKRPGRSGAGSGREQPEAKSGGNKKATHQLLLWTSMRA